MGDLGLEAGICQPTRDKATWRGRGRHLTLVRGAESGSWEEGPDRRRPTPPLGRLPLVAFGMACGVMIVALAFVASRSNILWAGPVFWVGQGVLYAVPASLLMLRRPITRSEALGVAWLVPLATYAITEVYSPIQFRFLDEFLTVRTAQSILTTHHLFHSNPALIVSPQYPGIEIVTTALASLSHLSIDASGTIVVGLAHLLLGLGIYFLMLEVTGRPRVAALVVLVYSTGPHFQFFDSYFIYEALALPLMVACLLAVVKMTKERDWNAGLGWGLVALLFAAATVATHHVTSYALLGFLLALELAHVLRGQKARYDWRLPVLIFLTAELIVVWDVDIATNTIAYFTPTVHSVLNSFLHLFTHRGHGAAVALPTGPRFDLTAEYLSILLLCMLAAIGTWRIWRVPFLSQESLPLAFAISSISLVVALVVRVVVPGGGQLWGRASTYFMLPVGLSVTFAISTWRIPQAVSKRLSGWRFGAARCRLIGVAAVVLLGIGGVAGGWPAYYARLPGSFRVEAWERSTDQHNLALAAWVAKELPPNYGVASGFDTANLLTSLGHEAAPAGVGSLFLSATFSPSARELVRDKRIDFIVVDRRMSQQLPADGSYFADDPHAGRYRFPIPARDLEKFNQVAGVSRIFEDGTMTVYALAGSLYTTTESGR